MLPRAGRRPLDEFRSRFIAPLIRYLTGTHMSDPLVTKNQQIADLQRELIALKLEKMNSAGSPLADHLLAQANLAKTQVSPTVVAPPITVPTFPVQASTQTVTDVPFTTMPEESVVQSAEPIEPAALPEEPKRLSELMMTPLPKPEPAVTEEAPKEQPRTFMPDVKMLAPVLKIALASLSIEEMVEIGLHVKMGAPGFREFLDSEIARTKFKELYRVYCDFLAGKIK